jgi:hypothetical protein
MADGLFNLCGGRTTALTKDGKTYQMQIFPLHAYARKEEAMLMRMGNPYAGIEAIADPVVRQQALKIAADVMARPLIATMQDEERFDRSFRGLAWGVWRALSFHHPQEFPPNATPEQGIQLGCNFIAWFNDIAKIIEAMHKVQEQDILGNSGATGPATA